MRPGDEEIEAAWNRIESRLCSGEDIHYRGSRQDLILTGAALLEWFPVKGKKRRRCRHQTTRRSEDYWCVSERPDGRFLVTRWQYWNDPEGARRAQEKLEQDEIFRVARQVRLPVDLMTSPLDTLSRIPNILWHKLQESIRLLETEVTVSPVERAGLAGSEALAAKLEALADEIRSAEIEYWTTLKIVPLSTGSSYCDRGQ